MDTFEQLEMRKNRLVITSKLNDWYDWLINHVPSTIKDGASRAFKTFKDKIRLWDFIIGLLAIELNIRLKARRSQRDTTGEAPPGGSRRAPQVEDHANQNH